MQDSDSTGLEINLRSSRVYMLRTHVLLLLLGKRMALVWTAMVRIQDWLTISVLILVSILCRMSRTLS